MKQRLQRYDVALSSVNEGWVSRGAGIAVVPAHDGFRPYTSAGEQRVPVVVGPRLLARLGDLEPIAGVDPEEVRAELRLRVAQEDALQTTLHLLDVELDDELRADCAAELEGALADLGVQRWLRGVLLARPLPASADVVGALTFARGRGGALIREVVDLQATVIEVYRRWQATAAQLGPDARWIGAELVRGGFLVR